MTELIAATAIGVVGFVLRKAWMRLSDEDQVDIAKTGTPVIVFLGYWLFVEPAMQPSRIPEPAWLWQALRLVMAVGVIGSGARVGCWLASAVAWYQITPVKRPADQLASPESGQEDKC